MILKIFSIYDKKPEIFNQPFYMLTNAEAIRQFENLSRDSESKINQNPLDYNLYQLGTFDNVSGETTTEVLDLGNASLFKQEEQIFPHGVKTS